MRWAKLSPDAKAKFLPDAAGKPGDAVKIAEEMVVNDKVAMIGGTFNGALTYYLVESIKQANGTLTYRELHQQTLARLKSTNYDQVPQLEGQRTSFDRPFLG